MQLVFLFGVKSEVQQHPVGLSACSSQSSTNTVGLVHPWAGVVKWPTSVVKKHPNHRFSLLEIRCCCFFFFFFLGGGVLFRNSQVQRSDKHPVTTATLNLFSVKCWDSFFHWKLFLELGMMVVIGNIFHQIWGAEWLEQQPQHRNEVHFELQPCRSFKNDSPLTCGCC